MMGRAETVAVFDSFRCAMNILAVLYEFHTTATQLSQTKQESRSLSIVAIISCAKE